MPQGGCVARVVLQQRRAAGGAAGDARPARLGGGPGARHRGRPAGHHPPDGDHGAADERGSRTQALAARCRQQ